MSYAELRKRLHEDSRNHDRHDHSWEETTVPNLHSGFIEACPNKPGTTQLTVTLFYHDGSYQARILDRANDEKGFVELGTLAQALERLEEALVTDRVRWRPDSASRNGF